jgi:hypothetical protein
VQLTGAPLSDFAHGDLELTIYRSNRRVNIDGISSLSGWGLNEWQVHFDVIPCVALMPSIGGRRRGANRSPRAA